HSATCSEWLTRDAAARLAIRNHLLLAERAHLGQHRTAQALYDAVVACYSSPATAALGRILLPYLSLELSTFATVEDLVTHLRTSDARYRAALPAEFLDRNLPPTYITLYFIVTRLPDSLRAVKDNFLAIDLTALTVDLLEQHLLEAETSVVAVGAARGTPRTPLFEGCSPSPLTPRRLLTPGTTFCFRLQLREQFRADLPAVRLHSDRGGEFSSDLLRDFCRGEGILESFTLPASPRQNGIAERRIGLVMEVARTSMIHAAAPHFLWPFAVRYAAHELNLWPRVSLPETSPTLLWTGEVGDASVFRVWGSRAFVRDTSADKHSAHALPCVDPLPGTVPVEVAVDSGATRGAASGGAKSGGAEPGGTDSEGAGSGGAEPGGAEHGGAEPAGEEPGGAEPESVEPGDAESEGPESGGAEPRGTTSSGGPASASP
ncbi:unnamed protein product, partial [Closterium sp. NIES-54]